MVEQIKKRHFHFTRTLLVMGVLSCVPNFVFAQNASAAEVAAQNDNTKIDVEALKTKAGSFDKQAQYELGLYYDYPARPYFGLLLNGHTNLDEAEKWYRLAADQNMLEAQLNLGILYVYQDDYPDLIEPLSTHHDVSEGIELIERAAQQGLANAQLELGLLYLEGKEGVEPNADKTIMWLKRAADQNDLAAIKTLSVIYGMGIINGKPDPVEEMKWAQRATELGDASEEMSLANSYYEGENFGSGLVIKQDYKKAYQWYEKAAAEKLKKKHQLKQ